MTPRNDKILLQCQTLERAIAQMRIILKEYKAAGLTIPALEMEMIIKKRRSQLQGIIAQEYPRVFKKGALK